MNLWIPRRSSCFRETFISHPTRRIIDARYSIGTSRRTATIRNIKARQAGQGIEQLFTEEEIAQMNAPKPNKQPQGASLSARTQVSTNEDDLPN